MGLEAGGRGGMEKEEEEKEKEKIPHMCESTGHQPLRGRCLKSCLTNRWMDRWTDRWADGQTNGQSRSDAFEKKFEGFICASLDWLVG